MLKTKRGLGAAGQCRRAETSRGKELLKPGHEQQTIPWADGTDWKKGCVEDSQIICHQFLRLWNSWSWTQPKKQSNESHIVFFSKECFQNRRFFHKRDEKNVWWLYALTILIYWYERKESTCSSSKFKKSTFSEKMPPNDFYTVEITDFGRKFWKNNK